jgi:putative transposase
MVRLHYPHCVGEAYLHLQLTPKYRREVFENPIIRHAIRGIFSWIAKLLGVTLEAVDFGPDHAHLFIGRWKNYSIPSLAQRFKGRSSFEIRRRMWNDVSKYLHGDSFWSDGYFFETVGSVTADARRFYIERCQKKHWENVDYNVWKQMQKQPQNQMSLAHFIQNPSGFSPR